MHRLIVIETISAALPLIITLAGLVIWWRMLSHRALFAVTGYLSLCTIWSVIWRLLTPIYYLSGPPASPEEMDKMIAFTNSSRTTAAAVTAVLLLAIGGSLLLWLKRALRRS
jgi:hypothetical protein